MANQYSCSVLRGNRRRRSHIPRVGLLYERGERRHPTLVLHSNLQGQKGVDLWHLQMLLVTKPLHCSRCYSNEANEDTFSPAETKRKTQGMYPQKTGASISLGS